MAVADVAGERGAMQEQRFDVWAAGDAYELYIGRWSRLVAERFLAWLGCGDGLRWLDVGCGTGALTATVIDRCRPRMVVGLDPSAGFLESARTALPASAGFAIADGQSLSVRDEAFDVVVSGLVLNFLAAPGAAVGEAARAVRPGGLVAAYVWDYAEGMAFLAHLRRLITQDRDAGLRPLFIAAGAGTVNTGVVDPLDEIAALAREFGLWFHADGAYGALGVLAEGAEPRAAGRGIWADIRM
ncbi:methyltransferase domain-containing protein [Streptomyces sp. NPDC002896]|uniref:class I SAM-dependent methyltransferase n=1 Tax=Streptomyces sp. NPDC002896 TaxID=3154438 RepID=UPI00331E4B88